LVRRKAGESEDHICGVRILHGERVARAREESLGEKDLLRLALTYKILGDPTRLKIVMALAKGEMCVCDLAAYLTLSESAVSHQLRRLKDLALVKSRRKGQILYYSLDDHHVEELLHVSLEHVRE
jgi:DNA-binding transcriptional ArsR family regulator